MTTRMMEKIQMSFPMRLLPTLSIRCLFALGGLLTIVPALTRAVVNGQATNAWPGMGAIIVLFSDNSYGQCGATLITPTWAITAAHCLGQNGQYKFTMNSDYLASDAIYYIPDLLIPNPNYVQGGDAAQPDDIGLIHFASPIPAVPFRINNDAEALTVGTHVWSVGYGQTVVGPEGSGFNTRKNIGTLGVGSISKSKLSTDANGPSFSCFGDSGGPWFVTNSDGYPLIVGSMTYLDGFCNTYSYAVPLADEIAFISSHVSDLCLRSTVGPPCEGIFRDDFNTGHNPSDPQLIGEQ